MGESILAKFKRFYKDIDDNIKEDNMAWVKTKVTFDFLIERIFHNIELIDYIQYRFYYKKKAERRKFATHGELIKVIRTCNDPKLRPIFDQKPLFNTDFESFLGRDWLNADTASLDDIKDFLQKHDRVFGKVPDGMFGKGIQIFNSTTEIKEDVLQKIKSDKLLLEESLTQYNELKEFNESSVNSMRVVTLNTLNDGVKVMAGVLRLGRKGRFADNFHYNGIASLIDVETGIVYTTGIDRNWNRYVVHPDSHKTIVGFKIPKWEEIKETVKAAALRHPEVRYIGWDVSINEVGKIVLIEGNPGADFDVTQIPDQVGVWTKFKPYIDEIEKFKNKR